MRRGHCPGFARPRSIPALPARPSETGTRSRADKRLTPGQKPVERRQRARRHDIGRDAAAPRRSGTGEASPSLRSCAPPRAETRPCANRPRPARTPGTPRIARTSPGNPAPLPRSIRVLRVRRDKRQQLRRIEHMPAPQIGERVAADKIDARRPAGQQIRHRLRAAPVFHVKPERSRRSPARLAAGSAALPSLPSFRSAPSLALRERGARPQGWVGEPVPAEDPRLT